MDTKTFSAIVLNINKNKCLVTLKSLWLISVKSEIHSALLEKMLVYFSLSDVIPTKFIHVYFYLYLKYSVINLSLLHRLSIFNIFISLILLRIL
jgi:hypothetical protein